MDGLVIGSTVLYTLPAGPSAGQARPAMVTRIMDAKAGVVSLHVFTDPLYDGQAAADKSGVIFQSSVAKGKDGERGTWNFAPAPAAAQGK